MKRIVQFSPQTLLNVLGAIFICIDHFGWSHQYYTSRFCQGLRTQAVLLQVAERVLWHTPHSCVPLASSWSDVLGIWGGLSRAVPYPHCHSRFGECILLPILEQGMSNIESERAEWWRTVSWRGACQCYICFPSVQASIAWDTVCSENST